MLKAWGSQGNEAGHSEISVNSIQTVEISLKDLMVFGAAAGDLSLIKSLAAGFVDFFSSQYTFPTTKVKW